MLDLFIYIRDDLTEQFIFEISSLTLWDRTVNYQKSPV